MKFAPGMRVIIRDEEWMIKKCDSNSYGSYTLQCVGISPLVKDKPAYFISDLEQRIDIVDPAKTRLIVDDSPHYSRGRLYLESQWRQMIPTDTQLHIGHKIDDRHMAGVRLATMHRVKGLEFTCVYLAGINKDSMPLKSAIQSTDADSKQEAMTAERCLLYVALTRAKKAVFVSGFGKPSPFLPA